MSIGEDAVRTGGDSIRPAILKDQFCLESTRLTEHEILELLHKDKKVPGVVEAVYSKIVQLPELAGSNIERIKFRNGLRQMGTPFMGISNVKALLRVAYDTLEGIVVLDDVFVHPLMYIAVLRFLRKDRDILHRDISLGNIMCNDEKHAQDPSTPEYEALCFADSLLDSSYVFRTSLHDSLLTKRIVRARFDRRRCSLSISTLPSTSRLRKLETTRAKLGL